MFYHLLILLIFKIFIKLKQLYFKEKYYNSHFNLKYCLIVVSLREHFMFNLIIFIFIFQIKIYKLINY